MVSRSARSASVSRCPTARSRRSPRACRVIGGGSAGSRPSRCSTCCAIGSTFCPEVTRAFVTVALPDDVLDAVSEATGTLQLHGARMMRRDQWHLTLQFLGDDADVDAVGSALQGFTIPGGFARLGGAGAFPNARRGRVLWIG